VAVSVEGKFTCFVHSGFHGDPPRPCDRVGNFDRTVEELEEAARLAPAWPLTARWLSEAYTLVGRYEDAVNAVDAGLRLNPIETRLWVQKAEVLLRGRQPAAAVQAALKAIELEPTDASAHNVLGYVYHDLGRTDDAEAAYRKAIELGPSGNSVYVNLANLLRERGGLDEAEALYRKALELEPDKAGALHGLATVFFSRNEFVEAENWSRKAVESDPNSAVNLNGLGSALFHRGQINDAEPYFRKALELEPGYAEPHFNLGLVCLQRQHWSEAEQLLLKAAQLDPRVSVERQLTLLYEGQGKFDQAEATLRQWLARAPDNGEACNELSFHLAERATKLDEALALIGRALERAPENPNYLDTLGWVQFKRGELDEAEKALQKAIELAGRTPTRVTAREHLKKVQEKKGKATK